MSKGLQLALAAVALVCVVLIVSRPEAGPEDVDASSPTPQPSPVDDPPQLVARQAATALEAPGHGPERSPELAAQETAPATEGALPSRAPARVTALLVDETGDPLAGAALTAIGLAGSPAALSGPDGRVVLELERGLERSGRPIPALKFVGTPLAFELSHEGRARRVVFGPSLEMLEQHDCGRFVLPPAGTVVGRVVGADGLPQAAIPVFAAPAAPQVNEVVAMRLRVSGLFVQTVRGELPGTETDFDGHFELAGVASGEAACVWAQGAETYATWTDTFEVAAGEILDVGTLKLEVFAANDRIEGQVFAADGRPVPEAMISAAATTGQVQGPALMRLSDTNGRFVIPAHAGETHVLAATDPHRPSLSVRLEGVIGGSLGVELRLAPRAPEKPRGPTITGRVLRRGAPAAQALITPHLADMAPAGREMRADDDGRFDFQPRPADRPWLLEARSPDGEWAGVSEPIELARDSTGAEVVIHLQPAASIEGLVLMDPDQESHGIPFSATGHRLTKLTSSRSGGSFEFEQLLPGSWTVQRGEASGPHRKHELALAPGQVAKLEIDLRGGARLEGRLALGDQDYSAWVWALRGARGKLDLKGAFRTPAIRKLGDAKLHFAGRMRGWVVEVLSDVSLAPGLNTWSLELPTGAVELSGLPLGPEVLDRGGQFEGVCALRYEHGDGTIWTATPVTAVDGRLVIEGVPAGRILVSRGARAAFQTLDPALVLHELDVRASETT